MNYSGFQKLPVIRKLFGVNVKITLGDATKFYCISFFTYKGC
ncbi:hypothetical protein RU96_GL001980 [Enterococcus canintestini]|uniref:Uncharacterized protein n=1 Tax=Enterococcus canintestini TaxID=317010 RepID=A0A1L8R7I9_9ENTE|nr:hypothetical protein RU96_GL001980 [Enterococcus canintestini]